MHMIYIYINIWLSNTSSTGNFSLPEIFVSRQRH